MPSSHFPRPCLRAMKAGVVCSVSETSDVNLSLSATPPERLDQAPQAASPDPSRRDKILQVPKDDNGKIAKRGSDSDLKEKEKNECRPTDVDRDQGHARFSSSRSQCADQFAEKPPSVQAPPVVDSITLQRLLKEEREQSDKRNSDHIRTLEKKVVELQRQNNIAELELQSQRQQMSNLKRDINGSTLARALQALSDEKDDLEQKLADLSSEVETMKLCQTQLEEERSRLLDSRDELQSTKEQLKALCCELEDMEREITETNHVVRAASFKHSLEIFDLRKQLCLANSRCKILELERDKPLWEEARVKRERKEQKEREMEERRRAEEILESMRKTEEEERRKEQDRTKIEEEARRERERAQAEHEERQRLQRQKWHEATKAEKRRCQRRDKEKWNLENWTDSQAVERFLVLTDEFETTEYSKSKPLTSSGIPWPVLTNPRRFKVTDLDDWQAVDDFFKFAKRYQEAHVYKKMVMRAKQMFHPDRWKSRSLLRTVMDDSVRSSLETAGNKVSQAVNAL
ncbi:uncharacterized protein EV420DRAFT_388546 [Desarmillaria tabescens]|uniref:Uncharacterized protein n=1 Tax=Armillaria tabescens TaxID=1929756 RepID=A0AA39KE28_ARMTA|nr:uncharacterized protein EV420DRAFT_388546 [Desarmillaria tabescens]KAK0458265.1 hypothetical protein EV420DRAFT_388546 [Desarmillaria tabescens]